MITTICFDVHGCDAVEIQDRAVAQLAKFSGDALNLGKWTIHIEVHEEATTSADVVALWRGEVRAMSHDVDR